MRASRLLSILLLLHTRARVSARELAAEFEVSVRTVYRDVEALGAAGIPVYATRGRGGGFALVDGFRTKLTGLTADEADALFLSGLPAAAAGLGLEQVLAATELKLLAALPAELRERAARSRDLFHLDAPGWQRRTETPAELTTVAQALWAQWRLRLRYQRANRTVVERVLEPLGLVLKAGAWYLVAAPAAGDGTAGDRAAGRGVRTYRVARVLEATVLPERFARPQGFRLAEHWAEYQRDYEQRIFHGTATIRLDETGRQLLFLIGSAARDAHAAMSAPDGDGWARTTVPIESVRHAHHALLQLGEHVDVLAPAELRELIRASAEAMVARYASGAAARSSPGG